MSSDIDQRIHILHLIRSLKVAGAEILLYEYLKSLGTDRYLHIVYNFGHDGPVRKLIENLGIKIIKGQKRASIKNPFDFILRLCRIISELLCIIKKYKIQMIQSHLSHANQLGVLLSKISRIPTFPTVHNTMEFVDARNKCDPRIYINKIVNKLVFNLADKIIAVSNEVKEVTIMQFHLPQTKIVVVKNGIVVGEDSNKSENLANEFPESASKIKLISVGRLYHQKGIDTLIWSIDQVVKSGLKNIFIMIVGDGADRVKLEKLTSDLNLCSYIKFLGVRNDVKSLLVFSDIFLMPSRYEGLSIAMVEAMAYSLPIIASDAPGLATYIHNGSNGLSFPVENHNAMAECIIKLSNDEQLQKRLSIGAKRTFENEFNLVNNIEPLKKLFHKYSNQKK